MKLFYIYDEKRKTIYIFKNKTIKNMYIDPEDRQISELEYHTLLLQDPTITIKKSFHY